MESLWNDSFVLFTKINVMVSELTDTEVAQLFRAILYYQSTGNVPENLDRIVSVVFMQVKTDMDFCKAQKEAKIAQSKAAGKKSAEARSAKSNKTARQSTPLNDPQRPSTTFNHNGDGDVNGDVDVNDNGEGEKIENKGLPPTPSTEGSSAAKKRKLTKAEKNEQLLSRILGDDVDMAHLTMLEQTLYKWMRYKGEDKKFDYKETGLKAFLSQVDSHVAEYGDEAVIKAINDAMAAGWQGVIWDKLEKPRAASGGRYYGGRDWDNI